MGLAMIVRCYAVVNRDIVGSKKCRLTDKNEPRIGKIFSYRTSIIQDRMKLMN